MRIGSGLFHNRDNSKDVLREKQPLRQADFLGEEIRRVRFPSLRNLSEFDWYQDWVNLRDIVSQFIKKDSKILNVGAGNSLLSEDMYKEGYRNITNVDFSEIVVDDMQTKYKKEEYNPSMTCRYANMQTNWQTCAI